MPLEIEAYLIFKNMFKLKLSGDSNSVANRLRNRFNNKSFFYRARIFIRVDVYAFYLRYLKK